jgi:hypothetical protein
VRRTIRIHTIENGTRPPVRVELPMVDGTTIAIEPGAMVTGPWLFEYETAKHPGLDAVAHDNGWYIEAPGIFRWNAKRFEDRDVGRFYPSTIADFALRYERPSVRPRG